MYNSIDYSEFHNETTKKCSKCGGVFPATSEYFHKNKTGEFGLKCRCKNCIKEYQQKNKEKIAEKAAEYYQKNKEKIAEKAAEYHQKNKEKIAEYYQKNKEKINKKSAEYYQKNKEKIAKYHQKNKEKINKKSAKYHQKNKEKINKKKAEYRQKNKEKISERMTEYRQNNKEKITEYRKGHWNFKDNIIKEISKYEDVTEDWLGKALFKCAYCGKLFLPTRLSVQNRLDAINSIAKGECRLYCSQSCKESCPTYGKIKHPGRYRKASSREANPILRQLVLKRDGYACRNCEATEYLHCHHEVPATQNPMTADDPDVCITLCKSCHKALHSTPGWRYHELKKCAVNFYRTAAVIPVDIMDIDINININIDQREGVVHG